MAINITQNRHNFRKIYYQRESVHTRGLEGKEKGLSRNQNLTKHLKPKKKHRAAT